MSTYNIDDPFSVIRQVCTSVLVDAQSTDRIQNVFHTPRWASDAGKDNAV